MKDFIDDNALTILGLIIMGIVAMTVKMDATSSNIVSGVTGGLLGYLVKKQ